MKLSFCTLFDVNYLERGLVLYDSLNEACPDFILYIVAMDDECYSILRSLELKNAEVIHVNDIPYKQLAEAKKNRSHRAFCWTCSSWSIKYVLERFNPDICTYLDADEYFYSSPEDLIMGFKNSTCNAAIIEHHYGVEKYAKRMRESSGTYCVQFNSFKNNERGLSILNDWCMDCADECTDRIIGNKFGDQKYLEDWPEKYDDVYIYKEIGAGVAPWNLYRYRDPVEKHTDNGRYLYDLITKKDIPVYFFHYHSLIINDALADINVFTRYGSHDKKLIYSYYFEYISRILINRENLIKKFEKLRTMNAGIKETSITGEKKKNIIKKINQKGIYRYIVEGVKFRLFKKLDMIDLNSISQKGE